jgi:hypothetical protein
MREALRQLQGAAETTHHNYTGATSKNLSTWS